MDSLDLVSSQKPENYLFIKNGSKNKKLIKCIIISLALLFILNIYTIYSIFHLNDKLNESFNKINNINIVEEYIKRQKNFCDNPDRFKNQQFEELIGLTNFSFRNVSYQMYVYKKFDTYMSNNIIKTAKYEPVHMSNFLDALQYYEKKNNLRPEDIFMLDIGGNLGAYPSFLGKFGYSILTFEASPRNSYIIYKNYCLINKNSNIIIVNKGLSNEEKICNYYSQVNGIGNGVVLCDENKEIATASGYNFTKIFEVRLTKLSNFLPYLSNKNIALIKLDIEGGEGKVIEDAIELISKYHVPFVFSEFNPQYLEKQGTNPQKFLKLFAKNGYKISDKGFLNVSYYINPEEINYVQNLYFIYKGK